MFEFRIFRCIVFVACYLPQVLLLSGPDSTAAKLLHLGV